MSTEPTFEYSSLHYLNQWLTHDKRYSDVLSGNNREEKLKILAKAASFYAVARTLPTKFDSNNKEVEMKRYEPILNVLDRVTSSELKTQNDADAIKLICEIEQHISSQYDGRSVLSLTTKFLWLKLKNPILIYDSQARSALKIKRADLRTEYAEYLQAYYATWRKSFDLYQNQIKKACDELPHLHLYAVDQKVGTPEYIKYVSSQLWFHERGSSGTQGVHPIYGGEVK